MMRNTLEWNELMSPRNKIKKTIVLPTQRKEDGEEEEQEKEEMHISLNVETLFSATECSLWCQKL